MGGLASHSTTDWGVRRPTTPAPSSRSTRRWRSLTVSNPILRALWSCASSRAWDSRRQPRSCPFLGEAPIAGADGRAIARAVRSRGAVEPVFVESLDELQPVLADILEDGDLVLTMGADAYDYDVWIIGIGVRYRMDTNTSAAN